LRHRRGTNAKAHYGPSACVFLIASPPDLMPCFDGSSALLRTAGAWSFSPAGQGVRPGSITVQQRTLVMPALGGSVAVQIKRNERTCCARSARRLASLPACGWRATSPLLTARSGTRCTGETAAPSMSRRWSNERARTCAERGMTKRLRACMARDGRSWRCEGSGTQSQAIGTSSRHTTESSTLSDSLAFALEASNGHQGAPCDSAESRKTRSAVAIRDDQNRPRQADILRRC
jgi:hypothetical protein